MVFPIKQNIMLLITIIDCHFLSHGVKWKPRIPGRIFLWSTVIRVRSLTRSPEYTLRLSSGLHVLPFIFANLSPTGYYAFSWTRAENAAPLAISSYFYTLSDDHVRRKNSSEKHTRAMPDNKADNVPRVWFMHLLNHLFFQNKLQFLISFAM